MLSLNKTSKTHSPGRALLKNSVIGENTLAAFPKRVAKYLGLPNVEDFISHSWRRSSATIAVEQGFDVVQLKLLGGWKSSTVAEGYVDNSIKGKKKRARMLSGQDPAETHAQERRTTAGASYSANSFTFTGTQTFQNCTFTVTEPTNN